MALTDWGKVVEQPKDKSWIAVEYFTLSNKIPKTILVYEEDEEYKLNYGEYRVWIGRTDGKDKGEYFAFNTKKQALAKARKLMEERK